MAVIRCANCATAVNAAATGCPQCGADPRTGEGAWPVAQPRPVPHVPIPAWKLILAGCGCALVPWLFWLLAWLVFSYSTFLKLSVGAGGFVPIVLSLATLVCIGFGLPNAVRQHASFWVYPLAAFSVLLTVANLTMYMGLIIQEINWTNP